MAEKGERAEAFWRMGSAFIVPKGKGAHKASDLKEHRGTGKLR